MSVTFDVSDKRLEMLRLVLVSRFPIVSTMYPDKTLSQSELVERSGTDAGNLSRYLREMIAKGVLEKTETESGVKYSLGKDARHILSSNLKFLTDDDLDLKELERDTWIKIKELLDSKVTRSLAADEFQRMSLQYTVSSDSGVLEELVGVVVDEGYGEVRNVLLLALSNFVGYLVGVSKDWVCGVLYEPLGALLGRLDDSDRGKRSRRIIVEIFDSLDLFAVSFDGLVKDCLEAVSGYRFEDCGLIMERLVREYPDRIVEFRLCLVEHYGGVDMKGKKIIESILGMMPL